MKIKLIADVLENGQPKMTWKPGKEPVVWVKGKEIEVSEATGHKLVTAGVAEYASSDS